MPSKYSSRLILDPQSQKGNLGDFRHASTVFVDGDYCLALKVKFLYHVVFTINTAALLYKGFKYKNQKEINILVKSAELPSVTFNTDTVNQYNRKKVLQTSLKYLPISIKFHDDNYGVVRQLFENYLKYYYADSVSADLLTSYDSRSSTKPGGALDTPYGLNNGSTNPFFESITIYQMSLGNWNSYKLVNPLLETWKNDTLSYSENATVEHSCTVAYESISFDSGSGTPPTFTDINYDNVRSPLTLSVNTAEPAVTLNSISPIPRTAQPEVQYTSTPSITELVLGKKNVAPVQPPQINMFLGRMNNFNFPGSSL